MSRALLDVVQDASLKTVGANNANETGPEILAPLSIVPENSVDSALIPRLASAAPESDKVRNTASTLRCPFDP